MDDFDTSESSVKEQVESFEKKEQPKVPFDFTKLLSNPLVSELIGSGKDLFKKKEVDPDMCEISIKAKSEVVLKLFGIDDEKNYN